MMNARMVMICALPLMSAGCFTVKTESEVKPIHITLDINLKVDKEIDKAFGDSDESKPQGKRLAVVKRLLERQVAGLNSQSLLEARSGATEEDRQAIVEANANRVKRFEEIAKSSGVSQETVRQRSLRRFAEKAAVGSGIWLQRADGEWYQK